VTLANWRTSPFNRWSFHHVRELLPTADIPHEPANVRELPVAPVALDGLSVTAADGSMLTLDQALEATSTDALVVLHKGRIVLEHYANGMTERSPHILMSISKSMLGLVAGILVGRGVLEASRPVTDIIPELKATAWSGATVGQLLDMRTGVAFNEDYLATSGPMIAYRKAVGWNPVAPGDSPSDLRCFFASLKHADGPHGGRFWYVSPNTDLLGWVIERAAGKRYGRQATSQATTLAFGSTIARSGTSSGPIRRYSSALAFTVRISLSTARTTSSSASFLRRRSPSMRSSLP
jgi:CubicO group peptidase (beta-lactamase class C family)